MWYTLLDSSSLEVSRLRQGYMGFGTPSSGGQAWPLDEENSKTIIRRLSK